MSRNLRNLSVFAGSAHQQVVITSSAVGLRTVLALACTAPMSLLGQGQPQGSPPPTLPSGFSSGDAIITASDASEDSDDGLAFTLGFTSLYDSNVTQVSSGRESDWIFTPSLEAEYALGNSSWNLGVRGRYEYDFYQNRDDFSGSSYSLGLFSGYQSKKFEVSLTTGISSTSGINRLVGGFIEQSSSKSGVSASYHFTPKTSLLASWDQSLSESQSRGFGDTSSETARLSAIWKATPLITLGPGFRYGTRTGNNDDEFTVMGPTLRLDYQLATKVKLNSTIGLDYADSPYSGEDTLLNWSLGLNYRASSLWGFNLGMIRDTEATLSTGGGFDETSSYRLTYWRKIRRARLQLGVSYEDRSATDALPSLAGPRDSQYLTLSTALTLPVFRDKAALTLAVNWKDQTTNDNRSWDGFQTSLGLRWQF